MTTAHRPTFDPARGKDAQRGPAYHQRLQPAHLHLKTRQAGQGGAGDANKQRDLRAELLLAEAAVKARKKKTIGSDNGADDDTDTTIKRRAIHGVIEQADDQDESQDTKRRRLILEEAAAVDADSTSEEDTSNQAGSESDESSSSEDDEDEEAELLRELAKIKAERAAQRAAEEAVKVKAEEDAREIEIAQGNPLLNGPAGNLGAFGVKRRWDDDVVFKNQARGTEEKGKRKEFVNDLLRSDFHKRFMSKYVR